MTQPPDHTQPLPPNVPPPPSTPPPGHTPQPSAPRVEAERPADRRQLVRTALGVMVPALTVVALAVEENDQRGYEEWTTWAVFATVVAAVHLLPLMRQGDPQKVWDTVAVATAGLVFYWVALVLPFIGNAASFAQTLAVAFALGHLWLLPGRR